MDSIDAHTLEDRSENNLVGVHPHLVRVVRLAHRMMSDDAPGLSFVVVEGNRSVERQAALVAAGASRTMNSYHLPRRAQLGVYGHAVDLAATVRNVGIRWEWALYPRLARRMKAAAAELGHRVTWGGDWDDDGDSDDESFRDGPHFQLETGPA